MTTYTDTDAAELAAMEGAMRALRDRLDAFRARQRGNVYTARDLAQDLQDDLSALLEASGAMVVLVRGACESGTPMSRQEAHGAVWLSERLAEMIGDLSKRIDAAITGDGRRP